MIPLKEIIQMDTETATTFLQYFYEEDELDNLR
jgi:hypothetical protein